MTLPDVAGALVLVVGPSGAGKDTLIGEAAVQLREDARFIFPRRLVTRKAHVDVEDHDTVSRDEFDKLVFEKHYCLAWEAHGLGYIIPFDVLELVDAGKIAVCNVSRSTIASAYKRLPNCITIFVDAGVDERARRLAKRGRENLEQVSRRLERNAPSIPTIAKPIIINNSNSLEVGVAAFVAALNSCVPK